MRLDVSSIDELINKSVHKEILVALINFIDSEYPSMEKYLCATTSFIGIGYEQMTYYQSESNGNNWPLIAIASQKNNVSLYIMGLKNDKPILSFYQDYFSKSSLGKSCLRITNINKIDFKILKDILDDAIRWHNEMKLK